jgi:phosphate:Na+ symporter
VISTLAPFLAGLGLFFSGVHFISANLTPLAGRRFRRLLGRMSNTPWVAAVSGIIAGIATQSSNAVTYVTIGLVNANALDLRRAVLIPTWSHVGTSTLVILVAVDFRIAASYVVALAGIGIYFGLSRSDQSRNAINILLGVGFLFLGLEMLKSGAAPLRDMLMREGLIELVAGTAWLAMLFGGVLTLMCQSSSVAGAIAVAATNIGLVDFSGACWMIYGANLGSAVNHYLLATGYRGEARQIALMQALQKLAGFAAVLIVLTLGAILQQPLIEQATAAVADTTASRVAWVFLTYQLLGSLACTLAFEPLLRLFRRLAPPSPLQEMSKPAFLLDEALVDPSFALELAGREERRLMERLPTMLDEIRSDPPAGICPSDVLRAASHSVTTAIANYAQGILEFHLDRDDRERAIRLQHRTANTGALFDAVDEFRMAARDAKQWPSSATVAESMVEALHALLSALVDATNSDDPAERDFVLKLLGHRDELMERMRQRVLRENPDLPAKAQDALYAATMLFERTVWLARRGTLLLAPSAGAGVEQAAS